MTQFRGFTLFVLALLLIVAVGLFVFSEQAQATPAAAGMMKMERLRVNTTGSDGSATGTGTTNAIVAGKVVRVDVNYTAAITNATGTDLTITSAHEQITTNIVSLTDIYTDTQLFPTIEQTDNTGSGRSTYDYYPVADQLTVTISGSNAFTPAAVIDIYWQE